MSADQGLKSQVKLPSVVDTMVTLPQPKRTRTSASPRRWAIAALSSAGVTCATCSVTAAKALSATTGADYISRPRMSPGNHRTVWSSLRWAVPRPKYLYSPASRL